MTFLQVYMGSKFLAEKIVQLVISKLKSDACVKPSHYL
jgi:hypothetical protein